MTTQKQIKLAPVSAQAIEAAPMIGVVRNFADVASQAIILHDKSQELLTVLNSLAAQLKEAEVELKAVGVCPYATLIKDIFSSAYAEENKARILAKQKPVQINAAKISNVLTCMRYAVKAGYWLGFNPTDAKAYYEKSLDTAAGSLDELKTKAGTTGRGKKETVMKSKTVSKRGIDSVLKSLFAHDDLARFQSQFTAKEWQKIISVSKQLGLTDSDFKGQTSNRAEDTKVSAHKRSVKAK